MALFIANHNIVFHLQIYAGIWHQAIYPERDEMVIQGKQGAVHASIVVDTVDEFGKWLKVPLKAELADR